MKGGTSWHHPLGAARNSATVSGPTEIFATANENIAPSAVAGIAPEHPVRVWPCDYVGAAATDEAVRYAVA